MADFVITYYLYIKSIHIISIIALMAGILYLPRLFVYHCENQNNKEITKVFLLMEKRLIYFIIKPAFLVAFISGLLISIYIYHYDGLWLHLKFLFVIFLVIYIGFLFKSYINFSKGKNTISSKTWKFLNEVPTILMIIIVLLVICKPI